MGASPENAPQDWQRTTFTKLEPIIRWRIAPDPRTTTLTEGCGVRIDNAPRGAAGANMRRRYAQEPDSNAQRGWGDML